MLPENILKSQLKGIIKWRC